ncbi:mannitol dehydrogenase family protein [Roseibium porphyridii]|uniref:Mannitol dehydrogenase family protein n=1 Tax=Roseibium porphyridii TaxID=2866279 RepID=A0ABY8F6L5_9HYPH|nr:mannitol dehydrogenase family protein [Roseibium sp. KMA01]WFE91121.1 mannitol dehydrogenase family protein [Roseibium sp. KMA01]
MSTTPIVQFGTSRFLQAHVDLFVSEALDRGEALGQISVVQSSGDAARANRLKALADPAGYDVLIKGVDGGNLVNTAQKIKSIRKTYSLPADVQDVAEIISEDAEIIISNTADAGFKRQSQDTDTEFSAGMSYPAKLTWFLHQRFRSGSKPLQVMPCELVPQNGSVLRDLVLEIAASYSPDFQDWLNSNVLWVNSLVDRIVSEPLQPAGAVAEPYALWAIEDQPGLKLPCKHPSIKVVQDLEEVETLKLFILNLGHTYLVSRWLKSKDNPKQFVRDMMDDPEDLADLEDLYRQEVVTGFKAHGREQEAEAYVATTLDRFRNPFLDHRLADIAQNHEEKTQRRVAGFLAWVQRADPAMKMPRLEKLAQTQEMAVTHEA